MNGDLLSFEAVDLTCVGGNDLLLGGPGVDFIAGDCTVETGDSAKGHVSGTGGNDTIFGGEDTDFIAGDHNGNAVSARGGNDVIDGGPGDDFAINGDSVASYLVSGASGNDTMTGGEGNDLYLAGDSSVFACEGVITADGGNDVIRGGAETTARSSETTFPTAVYRRVVAATTACSGTAGTISSTETTSPTRAIW